MYVPTIHTFGGGIWKCRFEASSLTTTYTHIHTTNTLTTPFLLSGVLRLCGFVVREMERNFSERNEV